MIFHRSRKQSNRSPLYYSVRKLNCVSYSPKQQSGHCWLTCYIYQSYFDLTWWFSIQMLMSVRNSWTAATTMPTVTTLWARMNVFAKMVLRETVACVLVRFNWGEHFATPCKLYRKLRLLAVLSLVIRSRPGYQCYIILTEQVLLNPVKGITVSVFLTLMKHRNQRKNSQWLPKELTTKWKKKSKLGTRYSSVPPSDIFAHTSAARPWLDWLKWDCPAGNLNSKLTRTHLDT